MDFQRVSWLLVLAILQVSDAGQISQEIDDGSGFTDPLTVGRRTEELGDKLSELRLEEIEKIDNQLSQLQRQRQELLRSRIEELNNQLAEQKFRGEQIEQQLTELRGQRIQDIENQLSQQEIRGKRIGELEDQLSNQTIIRSQIEAIQEQRIEELKNELNEQKLRGQQTEQQLTEIRGQMHDLKGKYAHLEAKGRTLYTACESGSIESEFCDGVTMAECFNKRKRAVFKNTFLKAPEVTWGINYADLNHRANSRVGILLDSLNRKHFVLKFSCWATAHCYEVHVKWMACGLVSGE